MQIKQSHITSMVQKRDAKDIRVDAYIAKSPEFAIPILSYLRELVHKACPHVQETIKWNFPHFEYQGLLCSMAAFKHHSAFGFWKAALLTDSSELKANNSEAMGHMGQIKSLSDLPPEKSLLSMIKEAVKLNTEGKKLTRKKMVPGSLKVPEYILAEFIKNKQAKLSFEKLSPSHKREYIEWITDAKTEKTRNKRVTTMMEWLTQGKSINWKYER